MPPKITITDIEFLFTSPLSQKLRWFAEQLRSGAEIPQEGRNLLAVTLEAIASGKTVKIETPKGPKLGSKAFWIAFEYTCRRRLNENEKDEVIVRITAKAWHVSPSSVKSAKTRFYRSIAQVLDSYHAELLKLGTNFDSRTLTQEFLDAVAQKRGKTKKAS